MHARRHSLSHPGHQAGKRKNGCIGPYRFPDPDEHVPGHSPKPGAVDATGRYQPSTMTPCERPQEYPSPVPVGSARKHLRVRWYCLGEQPRRQVPLRPLLHQELAWVPGPTAVVHRNNDSPGVFWAHPHMYIQPFWLKLDLSTRGRPRQERACLCRARWVKLGDAVSSSSDGVAAGLDRCPGREAVRRVHGRRHAGASGEEASH